MFRIAGEVESVRNSSSLLGGTYWLNIAYCPGSTFGEGGVHNLNNEFVPIHRISSGISISSGEITGSPEPDSLRSPCVRLAR